MRVLTISSPVNITDSPAILFLSQIGFDTGELAVLEIPDEYALDQTAADHIRDQIYLVHGVTVSQIYFQRGTPEHLVLQEAAKGNYDLIIADLIVKNGSRIGMLKKSSVDKLVKNSPCPIVVIKDRVMAVRRVLLCDSGSEMTTDLKKFSVRFLKQLKEIEEVSVLHVMSQMSAGPGVSGQQLRANSDELIRQDTVEGKILKQDLDLLTGSGIQVTAQVRHGLVIEEILGELKDSSYDLVIIGGHHSRGWQSLLLDDLARQIIYQVAEPVLVVTGVSKHSKNIHFGKYFG